jgi:hypothetical protein
MKITKRHKLYYRAKSEEVRRLDKTAPNLYLMILDGFIRGDFEKRYKEMNKNVKHWSELKPILVPVSQHLKEEMFKLTRGATLIIYHNSSKKPLVELKHIGLISD